MMKNSENCRKLFGKIESFLARIKNIFQLPLCFKTNLHTDITSAGQDAGETEQVSRGIPEEKMKKRIQHQIAVACPSKIRKKILKNLHAASVSKISPARAEIARKILAEIDKENALNQKSGDTKDLQIESVPAITEKQKSTSGIEGFALGLFAKTKNVFTGVGQRLCYGFGTNHVNQPVAS